MSAIRKCDQCGFIDESGKNYGWVITTRTLNPTRPTLNVVLTNDNIKEVDISYLDFCSAQCFNNYTNLTLEASGANETSLHPIQRIINREEDERGV